MKRLIKRQGKSLLKVGLGFSLIILLKFANRNSQALAFRRLSRNQGSAQQGFKPQRFDPVELPVELVISDLAPTAVRLKPAAN